MTLARLSQARTPPQPSARRTEGATVRGGSGGVGQFQPAFNSFDPVADAVEAQLNLCNAAGLMAQVLKDGALGKCSRGTPSRALSPSYGCHYGFKQLT